MAAEQAGEIATACDWLFPPWAAVSFPGICLATGSPWMNSSGRPWSCHPAARSAFLDRECSDPQLRRAVEELLAVQMVLFVSSRPRFHMV